MVGGGCQLTSSTDESANKRHREGPPSWSEVDVPQRLHSGDDLAFMLGELTPLLA